MAEDKPKPPLPGVDAPPPTRAPRDILPPSTGVPRTAQITGRPQTLVFKVALGFLAAVIGLIVGVAVAGDSGGDTATTTVTTSASADEASAATTTVTTTTPTTTTATVTETTTVTAPPPEGSE